jgi:hypothetical protein
MDMLVATDWRDDEERDAFRAYACDHPCVLAGALTGLRSAMADARSTVLVLGAHMLHSIGVDRVAAWLEAEPHRRHVVYRYSLGPSEVLQLIRLSELELDVRLSCRDHEPLSEYLRVWGADWPPSPAAGLMRMLRPALGEFEDTFAAVLYASERAVSEGYLADGVGLSASGFRARLRRMRLRFPRLPNLPEIVTTLVALHALYAVEYAEWDMERAAWRAGYDDPGTFATYVWRVLRATPNGLARQGGYSAVEGRVLAWFNEEENVKRFA